MSQREPDQSHAFRYFAGGVLCVAVALGGYFVRLNAQVDREREEAAERLALCRQAQSITPPARPGSLELMDPCKRLIDRYLKKAATL